MSLLENPPTLRERQIAKLKKMLHLNVDVDKNLVESTNQEELIWKALILDRRSTAIVSSVLRVNDLLEYGITMHALVDQRRAALPDVPAIYFFRPTTENIAAAIQDASHEQYADQYVNFTSSLSRSLLEVFAKKIAQTGHGDKIKQVYDQYLDFIVTEPNLFSLDMPKVYSEINNPHTTEDQINTRVDEIVSGLFCTVLTMGSIPVIRCNRGGAAELVSQRLDQKLRDHVINTRTQTGNSRLVLVILDRNVDLVSTLAHSWIYECMVSDVFQLDRNTIEIPGDEPKRYDIDPSDFFWMENAALPFPDAVENVEAELSKYTAEAKEISANTGYSSIGDIDPNNQTDTQHIQEAIKALPELTQRKNIIDMHMTVLTDLIKELDAKNLDAFFEIEQNMSDPKTQKQFLDLLKKQGKENNSKDKLRTYLIMYLQCDLPKAYCDECEKALQEQEVDLSPLEYIKQVKEINKMSTMNTTSEPVVQTNSSSNSALLGSLSSKLMGLTEGTKLNEGLGSLISSVKNLLPAKKNLPITNIVESIMSPTTAKQESINVTDDYLYFDPNVTRGSHSRPPKRSSYNEAVVFVVGGGNYLEYSNLQDWSTSTSAAQGGTAVGSVQKIVTYGSTQICNADGFLAELGQLGTK